MDRSSGDEVVLLYFLVDQAGGEQLAATATLAPAAAALDAAAAAGPLVLTYRGAFHGPPHCEPLVTTRREELAEWLDRILAASQAAQQPEAGPADGNFEWQPEEEAMDEDAAAPGGGDAAGGEEAAGADDQGSGQLFFISYRCGGPKTGAQGCR